MSPRWREHLKKFVGRRGRCELRHGPCSRNWPPAPAIARQKLVGFLRPLATSLIERKPIRSCATPCIEERLDHSPTGVDPRAIHPWEFESNGRRSQVAVGGSFVVNDPNVILQAAIDGVGIANLAEMMVAAAISEGKLVPLLRNWERRMSGLFLYYSSRRQVPAPLQAFIAFMRRHKNAVRSGQIAQPRPADDQMISSQPRFAATRAMNLSFVGSAFVVDVSEPAAHQASVASEI